MLVIGFLCPVGEKTRMKIFNTKQRYLGYELGKKINNKNRQYGTDYISKFSSH